MRGVLSKRVRVLPSAHPASFSCPARAPTQPNEPLLTRLRPGLVLAATEWTKKFAMVA